MRLNRGIWTFVILTSLCLTAVRAGADNGGGPGVLLGMVVNRPASDNYSQLQGKLVIQENFSGNIVDYRWGGMTCSGRILSDGDTEKLADVIGNRALRVAPFYKPGLGGVRCIVGYIIAEESAIDVITDP